MAYPPRLVPNLLSLEDAELAMDATPDGCALLDGEGVIRRTNLPWTRGRRASELVGATSIGVGADLMTACASAAITGNRRAGTLHAQLKRILSADLDRVRLEFEDATGAKTVVSLERVVDDLDDLVLVAIESKGTFTAEPTSVPEAGFAVPGGARLERLAVALDSLAAHAAILDGRGRIVAVNAAWRIFSAVNGGDAERTNEGVNYLTICERAAEGGDQRASHFLEGLRAVLRGDRHTFHADSRVGVDGHSVTKFRGRVTALGLDAGRHALVTHTQVTAHAGAAAAAVRDQAA